MEKEKLTFNEILKNVRSDLEQIANLYGIFIQKIETSLVEAKDFFYDVFMDKIYETNYKINKIAKDFGVTLGNPDFFEPAILMQGQDVLRFGDERHISNLSHVVSEHILDIESFFSLLRKTHYKTDWKRLEKIKPVDYILEKRKKFISAREELTFAREAIDKKDWSNVSTHLRSAIDLGIKEKFGFKKIHPMANFLDYANEYDLPLPSYKLIYSFFDLGSKRLHNGIIYTPFEAKESLIIVTNFIDQLDLMEVDQNFIDDFKKKCKFVE